MTKLLKKGVKFEWS
jgi:ribonuclease HI